MSSSSLKLSLPRQLEIGQLYSITWRNGLEKKDGQIIEKRRIKKDLQRLEIHQGQGRQANRAPRQRAG